MKSARDILLWKTSRGGDHILIINVPVKYYPILHETGKIIFYAVELLNTFYESSYKLYIRDFYITFDPTIMQNAASDMIFIKKHCNTMINPNPMMRNSSIVIISL